MKFTKLAIALGALVMAGSSMAATDSANLTTSATVENICAIGTGTAAAGTLVLDVNLGAGTANPQNHDFVSSGISVICTVGASAQITADLGLNAAGSTRNMLSGADTLAYELYADAGRTNILGSDPAVANKFIAYTGTGAATTTTSVYGRITGAQLAAAPKGTYGDTVSLTVNYTP